MRPGEMGPWEMMPWYGMFLGPLMMILFIALVVVIVVLIVRWLGGPAMGHDGAARHRPAGGQRDAVDILRERFARGEIDEEEFHRRKRLLEE